MRRPLMMLVAGAMTALWAMPVFAQDPMVAKGAALFESNKCSICHSVQGKGGKKPLDGAGARLDAATVKLWLTDPKGAEAKTGKKATPPMKNFSTLPAGDIDALIAYVMSLK